MEIKAVAAPDPSVGVSPLTEGEIEEMTALGLVGEDGEALSFTFVPDHPLVERHVVSAPGVLNEAPDYGSAFSRALSVNLGSATMVLISGTASVDEGGATVHINDFRGQLWRTFRNITNLLEAEGLTWKDIVRTTCYIRDIERDYADFNDIRNKFYRWLQLDPLPASTAIQARICRSDLLVEIEAIAIRPNA